MNRKDPERILLEERARQLTRAAEDINKLLKDCNVGSKTKEKQKSVAKKQNEKQKPTPGNRGRPHYVATNQNEKQKPTPGSRGRPQQSRGSQSLSNLSASTLPVSSRGKNFRGCHRGRGRVSFNSGMNRPCPPSYDEATRNSGQALHYLPPQPSVPPASQIQHPLHLLAGLQMYNQPPPSFPQQPGVGFQPPQQASPMLQFSNSPNTNVNVKTPLPFMTANILQPKDIVQELINIRGFWSSIESLSRVFVRHPKDVMDVIDNYPRIFSHTADQVELCPKIKLCSDYMKQGCQTANCNDIHICPYFVLSYCSNQNCSYGHNMRSNHNNRILEEFCLDQVASGPLREVIKKILKGSVYPKICSAYQHFKCNIGKGCGSLHICYQYVISLGNCPNSDKCRLNHKILDPTCRALFDRFGNSSNESPRDLLRLLVDNLNQSESEVEALNEAENSKNLEGRQEDNRGKDSDEDSVTSASGAKKKKKENTKKNAPQKYANKDDVNSSSNTVFSWQMNGNVQSPFICLAGIKGNCPDVRDGCKYLHSRSTFHWQFGGKKWYNFHPFHSKILERHYRDVSCDKAILPTLDPQKILKAMKDMPCMLGGKPLNVDFTNMTIYGGNLKEPFTIRQLTTPSAGMTESEHSSVFKWYFYNAEGKWQMYESTKKSGASSEDIEKAYLAAPATTFNFSSNSFQYKIDFYSMTQENLSTKMIRPVTRRPQPYPNNENSVVKKIVCPSNWEKMDDSSDCKLVLLSNTSDEFREIRQIVHYTFPMCVIVTIMRVQNEHIFKQFKNKEDEIKTKYKQNFLNVQKLFTGTDDRNLGDICRDNLDWRIHGVIDKSFGQGAVFFNSAAAASRNCTPDQMGVKKLLIFDVIIGNITSGSSSMIRPPENPETQALYDTTVDDPASPGIFVKYNKQEYYPAYVVQFK